MKLNHILAATTLLIATLAFQMEASANFQKATYKGHVIEVNQDEEGSSIVIQNASGLTQSVYAPRSRANEEIVERAIKAREDKATFTISTQNL